MIGIYLIQPKGLPMFYVGGSTDIEKRWETHKGNINNGAHHCLKLQAISLIEPELEYTVLEECFESELKSREQHYIELYQTKGYLLNTTRQSSFSKFDDPVKLVTRFQNKVIKHKEKEISRVKRREKLLDTYGEIFTGELSQVSITNGSSYRDLITVVDNEKMNVCYGSSSYFTAWFVNNMDDNRKQIKTNLVNFFKYIQKSPSDKNLWTTYESTDHAALLLDKCGNSVAEIKRTSSGILVRDELLAKPYRQAGKHKFTYDLSHISDQATDEEIEAERKRACWLPVTSDSHLFTDRTSLAFIMNIYIPTELKTLCKDTYDIDLSSDDFALRLMLRWVFQSAIRNGQPITVYIPSMRMRHLFLKWLGYTDNELF